MASVASGRSLRKGTEKWLLWLALAAGALLMMFPIYWMFATAVRPKDEVFSGAVQLLPSSLVWSNFLAALSSYPFLAWAGNTAIIAILAVCVTVFINLLCGYAFAKYRFIGRNVLFIAIVSALMIPVQVILVPIFLIDLKLGLFNHFWGVILPRAAEAFGIFMVRQYMMTIPDDLIEAARLDGAGEFRIFWSVVLPLAKPIIAVLVIFNFMWRWNDFSLPLVILTDPSVFTVQLGINLMRTPYSIEWQSIMGLGLLSLVPMLVIFVLFQRQFVQGVAGTGLK
jgi:ABC-type glycerol-3-phosphate transport system permease component